MADSRHRRLWPALLAVAMLALLVTTVGGGSAPADSPPPLPDPATLRADRAQFLRLAEDGLRRVRRHWWNSKRGWYEERLHGPREGKASIWTTVHLFSTLEGVARAAPTGANRAAVRRFADRSHREYWNPVAGHIRHTRRHVGGYSPSSRVSGPRAHVYYDDNGWLGLAYLDAYRITHVPRYLSYADSAFQFTAQTGWADGAGGGVWWDTRHTSRSSEGITSNTLLGALLYEITRRPAYLSTVRRYVSWADSNIWDPHAGLYIRDPDSPILMRYVQSPMIAAFESLCRSTRDRRWCAKGERLADNALAWFPAAADHGPQYDEVYLRWMLDLYGQDHDPRWYALAYYNAGRALAGARSRGGLFLRAWNGSRGPDAPADSLKFEASTLSLFAWVAAYAPPAS